MNTASGLRKPSQVVTWLSAVDFGRGSEALYRDQMPGLLTELADRARVLSITASSAIEGIVVADADRAQRIIEQAPAPALASMQVEEFPAQEGCA
ncbi:MAG: hypothetical protein M3Y33_01485 [Actinomycetota bacterium]|nr:hypothetical protein [Actinomycetota bacterium]